MKTYMSIKRHLKNRVGRLIPLKELIEGRILANVRHPDPYIENSGNGIILRKGGRECLKAYVSY